MGTVAAVRSFGAFAHCLAALQDLTRLTAEDGVFSVMVLFGLGAFGRFLGSSRKVSCLSRSLRMSTGLMRRG